MTVRLYYSDAYITDFRAKIVDCFASNGKPAVVLDKTHFYPSNGGQPHDFGHLGNAPVVDVFVRPEDHAIVHVLGEKIEGHEVRGIINWERRFDHMQQHTGQHILSQAFQQLTTMPTISFHMGRSHSTIDVDGIQIDDTVIHDVERSVNQVIWDDRPVRIHMVSKEQALAMPLRTQPDVYDDNVRLVEIERFDLTPCGGTHVGRTGEIGLVKITGVERRGNHLRIEFLCGRRALLDYASKHKIVAHLMTDLTTSSSELGASIVRLQEELKQSRRQLKKQTKQLISLEAINLLEQATVWKGIRIISKVFSNRDTDTLRILAGILAGKEKTIILLGVTGASAYLVFARSHDAPGQMDQLLGYALKILGSSAGGGSATFAQGGGTQADRQRVSDAIDGAKQYLLAVVNNAG